MYDSDLAHLPACRIATRFTSVSDVAGSSTLLGLSVCPDRMGQAASSGKDHRLLRQPQYPVSGFQRAVHCVVRVCWRYSHNAWSLLQADRFPSGLQHVRCILDRRSGGADRNLLRSRKVLRGRSIYLPVRIFDDPDLRGRPVLDRYSDFQTDTGHRIAMTAEASTRSEAGMIAAILAGDTQLYHELIRPYERSVYLMALSYLKNEADAEDVAQEAFVKAFRSLSSFRAEAKFSTWLISITLNEARSRLRRQSVIRMESLDEPAGDNRGVSPALLRDWREIPSEVVERAEIRQLIIEAIGHLSPLYREVLLLRDVEEFSIEETAAALTITPGTVKVRLHRARMMMQKELAPKLKNANPRRRWFQWS